MTALGRMRRARGRWIAVAVTGALLTGCTTAEPRAAPGSSPSPSSSPSGEPRAAVPQIKVTVERKWRVKDTIRHVAKATGVKRAKLRRALGHADLPRYAKGRVEGLLPPGRYSFDKGASPEKIADGLLARHREIAGRTDLVRRARAVKLSPAETMTAAAIVEAESSRRTYMPKVAAVIHNRLRKGMKLQMDTTVRYGVGKRGNTATLEDLRSDSPYNSYRRAGLPPGPITSPGEAAIEATLSPAAGDAVFFLVLPNGSMRFTGDYNEFRAWRGSRTRGWADELN